MTWGDHEPVLVRKGRRVHNTRNPAGRVLVFAAAVGLFGAYLYVSGTGQWSGSELRDAVHEAARDLAGRPQRARSGYDSLIRDAGGDLLGHVAGQKTDERGRSVRWRHRRACTGGGGHAPDGAGAVSVGVILQPDGPPPTR